MNEKVKSIFDFFKKEDFNSQEEKTKSVAFSEVVSVDGITLYYEVLEVGQPIFMIDAETNEQLPSSPGDFQVEIDGKLMVISVDDQGLISAIEEVMSQEDPQTPEMMSKDEFNEIITKVINDTLDKFSALEQKLEALLNQKESKFKDERKKVEEFKTLSVKEILTKK